MIQLGKTQKLVVVKEVQFGIYLGDEVHAKETVLLPKKQVPDNTKIGDEIEVFIYKDSSDRIIATTNKGKLELGQVALLEVVEVTKIGAFLNWGLEKDLFLPFKEQTKKVDTGEKCLVTLYIDKSSRLCATMHVYEYLSKESPYTKDDMVTGILYEISNNFGGFVAVDYKYSALIPHKEMSMQCKVGDLIEARVTGVKEDGKLDLSIRQKAYIQMDEDADLILGKITELGGRLPFTDKADAEIIKENFDMSKNAFKRAIGRLLKQNKIEIMENFIQLK